MDPVSLSVSQLCRAAVDPAWLERWIRGENPSVQVFAPPGTITVHGTRFHGFARAVVSRLLAEPSTRAEPDLLFEVLLGTGAGAFVDSLLDGGDVDSAAGFTNALHLFVERLVQLHRRAPSQHWSKIFVAPEFAIHDARFEIGEGLVFVSGAIDCVRYHPEGEWEVVDYKLTRGSDLPKELVQVAVYRQLLQRVNGMAARGALEYFAPKLHVQELTGGDLDATFRHWVEPALARIVEGRKTPNRSNAKPAPAPKMPTVAQHAPRSAGERNRHEHAGSPRFAGAGEGSPNARKATHPPTAPSSPTRLTVGSIRALTAGPSTVDTEELKRHVAVLGGSGSGKTTLALSIVEQLLEARIPVVLIDRKGDLCRYGDPELRRHPEVPDRLLRLLDGIEVAVFTPGQDRGRGLSINLVPPGVQELPLTERLDACRDAAAALGAMLGIKQSATDQAKLAVLVQSLRILTESTSGQAITLPLLIDMLGSDDPVLLESLGALDPKHCRKLAEQLQTMQIMRGDLLAEGNELLSAELLFGRGVHGLAGKTRLSVVSTKFLGDDAAALFWVSQLLLELNRYASRSPSGTLQGAVMFDEADLYLPATSKPPTKGPLESLLKRGRSAGLSIMLATQSPGDLDYKCRENVRTWFVGLVKEPRALEKLKPMLSDAKVDAAAVLPKQKVGQFLLVTETAAVPINADRNLVQTEQLSEPEIVEIARATSRSSRGQ